MLGEEGVPLNVLDRGVESPPYVQDASQYVAVAGGPARVESDLLHLLLEEVEGRVGAPGVQLDLVP